MKNQLALVSDFIARHVGRVMVDARSGIGHSGGEVPALRYFRNNIEFSLPIDYEYFVKIGMSMRTMDNAKKIIDRMGSEFAFFAGDIAIRSDDPLLSAEDRLMFISEIEAILQLIAPQAFFVSMPVCLVGKKAGPGKMRLLDGGQCKTMRPNAIIAMGCNRVHSHTVITPFVSDDDGNLTYKESRIFDSLLGHNGDGLFCNIYAPSGN